MSIVSVVNFFAYYPIVSLSIGLLITPFIVLGVNIWIASKKAIKNKKS